MIRFLVLLIVLIGQSIAGNYFSVKDTTLQVNQSFPLTIELSNKDSIIAFQLDVELPSAIVYDDSFSIASRLAAHRVQVARVDNRTLRMLCYSINNNPIAGNTGSVAKLFCRTTNQVGVFEVRLKNGVLADRSSRNVLDSLRNGMIQILEPTGIHIPSQQQENPKLLLYPNPLNRQLNIKFYSATKQPLEIYLFNVLGELIFQKSLTPAQTGWLEKVIPLTNLSSGNYIVGLKSGNRWIKKKIIIIK